MPSKTPKPVVRNAARALMGKVRELRGGKRFEANDLADPRPK